MLARNNIIGSDLLGQEYGANINGPSCIVVPPWCAPRLGSYYLYFAHHHGDHIRLATADDLKGPWQIYKNGVLNLSEVPQCHNHIASPDVIVNHQSNEIWMYFHGVDKHSGRQLTYFSSSKDGLHFNVSVQPIAPYYLRVVRWRNLWIGMSKGGVIWISENGRDNFNSLHTAAFPTSGPLANAAGDVRHVALAVDADRLWVLFTKIGDAPEHIRLGYIDLLRPIAQWKVEFSVPLIAPKYSWEGADLPLAPSRAGAAYSAENALRDPALLINENENILFYSYAGESGIGCVALPKLSECFVGRPWITHWAPNSPNKNHNAQIDFQIRMLAQPGMLQRRLLNLDAETFRQRIFVMGCGRSGTWLLTSLMECFDDLEIVKEELPVEAFGIVTSVKQNIILKRNENSYKFIDNIPKEIGLIFLVRHPFDVLTSHNPTTKRKYHISVERWIGEMKALIEIIENDRPNTLILKYEDLVQKPNEVLRSVSEKFKLKIIKGSDEVLRDIRLPPKAVSAMHGQRSIDTNSVNRYLRDPQALNYLREILPQLTPILYYVSKQFNYDVNLPELVSGI